MSNSENNYGQLVSTVANLNTPHIINGNTNILLNNASDLIVTSGARTFQLPIYANSLFVGQRVKLIVQPSSVSANCVVTFVQSEYNNILQSSLNGVVNGNVLAIPSVNLVNNATRTLYYDLYCVANGTYLVN